MLLAKAGIHPSVAMLPWAPHVEMLQCACWLSWTQEIMTILEACQNRPVRNRPGERFFTKANQKNEERSVGRLKSDGV